MKKILVIEDVEFNRDLMVQLLEDSYEVVTASDGHEGLERAQSGRPDLILMDLSLPGLDGWELTRRIKTNAALKHIPIIAVSAHAMTGDEQRARDSGCDDYISKPIDEEILFGKLRKFLQAP
jgi:CheY-like chemotaxis protein